MGSQAVGLFSAFISVIQISTPNSQRQTYVIQLYQCSEESSNPVRCATFRRLPHKFRIIILIKQIHS